MRGFAVSSLSHLIIQKVQMSFEGPNLTILSKQLTIKPNQVHELE